jgi:IS30 family transposase
MSYTHLSRGDRYVIAHLRIAGWTMRRISRRVGRSASTVSREPKRNGPPADATRPYWYECAQSRADERWRIARHWYRRDNVRLRKYVNRKTRLGWSPEQVVSRLALDHSQDRTMRLGVETLYRWIYADAQQGGDLYTHLRGRHQKRPRQRRYGAGRRFISGRVGIECRPEAVSLRERFGDWEGDTVIGARGRSQIATHVERKSRYLMAARLNDRKADTFAALSSQLFRSLPAPFRKTLTLDNGSECARFDLIEKATGVSV